MEEFTTFQYVYMVFAVFGSVSFLITMVMHFIGMGDGVDTGGDAGGADFDSGDISDGADTDADASFKLLSFQGLVAFFMMFGLVGLAGSRSEWEEPIPLVLGLLAGGVSIWVVKKIFEFANSMQSSGTMDIRNVVGKTGSVYTRIPKNGIGKVIVTTGDSRVEMNAKTVDSEELGTGEPVSVIELLDNGTVLVEKK